MRKELQKRLVEVSASLISLHKVAHDEPEVDSILSKVDNLLADALDKVEQLKVLQQDSKYTEAAGTADRAAKSAKDMSDLLLKASILLKQRASI